jgi:hypothetical protein
MHTGFKLLGESANGIKRFEIQLADDNFVSGEIELLPNALGDGVALLHVSARHVDLGTCGNAKNIFLCRN